MSEANVFINMIGLKTNFQSQQEKLQINKLNEFKIINKDIKVISV